MTVEWNCLISANFIMCIVSLEKEGNNEKKFFYYTNIFKIAIKLVTAAYVFTSKTWELLLNYLV